MFHLLKSAPPAPKIENPDQIKSSYKYWRFRIFYGMYIGYIFYYFTRKSFTFAMPALMKDLGYTKTELGVLATILSLTYGFSKFLSGILSDRANPRYFMAFGLIMTGILNIVFGFFSSIAFFALFWGLNGFFQGWGWPPCARLLTHWYSQKERGSWWGIWNTSHNIGGALIPLVATTCAECWGWRYAMYVPGMLCIAMGLFIMNRLRDTPQSLGLPSVEDYKNDHPPLPEEHHLTTRQILTDYIFKNKYIWLLAFSYFFVYIVRTAINDWSVLYLVEQKQYSLISAGACVFSFEIGGMFGSLVAGFASDKIFSGRRGPVNVLFTLAVIVAISLFWIFSSGMRPMLDSALLFSIGFLIFGPQMLIGVAATELSSKKAAGTATGFVGLFAYMGAAFAGLPLGVMAENLGWRGFYITVIACAAIALLFLLPLWSIKYNTKLAVATKENDQLK